MQKPKLGARVDSSRRIQAIQSVIRRLIHDESGAEILEYVLIAGLIIAATITVIAGFGTKVLARWTSVSNSSL